MLGRLLVRAWPDGEIASGIIVEVEAYLSSGDPASHSYRGLRGRNASMFKPPGTLYVYAIHSRHCLNIVTEAEGSGSAVLIRAIEPYSGLSRMIRNTIHDQQLHSGSCGRDGPLRQRSVETFSAESIQAQRLLGSGPGRLCRAFEIDRSLDGVDLLTSDRVWLSETPAKVLDRAWSFRTSPRIGISQGIEHPLRWFMDGHQMVSGLANTHTRGRNWTFGRET